MLEAIKRFFDTHIQPQDGQGESSEHALQLATAALMLEMSRMDDDMDASERQVIHQNVRERFDLSAAEADELVALAGEEAQQATDYHQFTSLIHEHFSPAQKIQVIEQLWRVASQLDKHEEYMMRKIADLLYVSHRDFIAAKHRVTGEE